MTRRSTLLAIVAAIVPLAAQNAPTPERLLARRYVDGQRLEYLMSSENDGTASEVHITSTTRRGSDGFFDEIAWSNLVVSGMPRQLPPAAQEFRMAITLEGKQPFAPPDLSKAIAMIGPVTDLMTFYADLFLAMHAGHLQRAGDSFKFANPRVASWADGAVVILGEDHVDFEIRLQNVDTPAGTATLRIKHVPPAEPKIHLPADWMRARVADIANNFVQVQKTNAGFAASVGQETFDVTLNVALADGRVLQASMDNPVVKITRQCSDAALTQCEPARSTPTLRRIKMSIVSDGR